MTKTEILSQYKKKKKNTYRECDVINAMEKYLESYKNTQALQLQQTDVIKSFYCGLYKRQDGKMCKSQCGGCADKEARNKQ